MVAGGPGRLVAIVLAVCLGVWVARHWRERPEMVVFACAVALALRSYSESVLDAYYPWAALAVGVVIAARCARWRFGIAVVLGIAATVLAQVRFSWLPWWTIQIACLTALLVVVSTPKPAAWAPAAVEPVRSRKAAEVKGRSARPAAKKVVSQRSQAVVTRQNRATATKKATAPRRKPSGRG